MTKNCVLLETSKPDKTNKANYFFADPVKIITTGKISKVKDCLKKIEKYTEKGFYAAGFLSYEAGYAFEGQFKSKRTFNFPLLWFGIFKRAKEHKGTRAQGKHKTLRLKSNISKQEYLKSITKIKKQIKTGNTYQVNYTFKHKFKFSGDAMAFYEDLKEKQATAYSAFISTEKHHILSLSPELFFKVKDDVITVKPMKGTIERGKTLAGDKNKINLLKNSRKNKAENLMIVDLLRNDLGKICETGSVKTKKLFEVEKFSTLLQMTSTIEGKLKKNTSIYDMFKGLFPSGSVTGAPKIRTMRIIQALEKEPRNIYCGAIGFISPNQEMAFNVAIRTALINKKDKIGELGIGGGITYASNSEEEFKEARLKAKFLTDKPKKFKLIETMRWEHKKGIALLPHHLKRIKSSAKYFGFNFNKKEILESLNDLTGKLDKKCSYRIRLLLSKDGSAKISARKIHALQQIGKAKICLSKTRTNSQDVFLYHKTTRRNLYNRELKKYRRKGFFDVIFQNEKGEITEGAISNIFIKSGRCYYTPPIKCGLLAGTQRAFLLKQSGLPIKEKILYLKDLKNADKIFISNAIIGLAEVFFSFSRNHPAKQYQRNQVGQRHQGIGNISE